VLGRQDAATLRRPGPTVVGKLDEPLQPAAEFGCAQTANRLRAREAARPSISTSLSAG
jgi:hypothetical protein